MKVMIISTVYPYPKDNGKTIILSSILEYFIEFYGADKITYVLLDDDKIENVYDINLLQVNKPKAFEQIKNVISRTILTRKFSLQESFTYSKHLKNIVIKYIRKEKIDLVIYDTLRIFQMFEDNNLQNVKEIIYLDDLFSIRYQKMIDVLDKLGNIDLNPLGNFKKFIPKPFQKIVRFNLFNRLLLSYEKNLIMDRENKIVNKVDINLLISKKEVEILKTRTGNSNIYAIPPLLPGSKNRYNRNYRGASDFIFLGSLNIPHNDVAICNFINENFPSILKEIPDLKLKIIGRNPSDTLKKLAIKYSNNIILMGFIDNLEEVFNSACAMIVPLLFGSGVKLKTLEAFSYGLPVICTDYGIEGIDIEAEGCIVENDIKKYSKHMKKLTNINYNNKISKTLFKKYMENYSKEAVYEIYKNIFKIGGR
ncbi:glycosyl transferase [Aeribacillus pallidus]|nr:glycosyl transferase [Aeribacillus pallidus]